MKFKIWGFSIILCVLMTHNVYADNSTWLFDGRIVSRDSGEITQTGDLKSISVEKPGWNRLVDYGKGYGVLYPGHMYADVSISGIKDVLFDEDTAIEIYHDNFNGTLDTYYSYRNYSNIFRSDRNFFRITKDINETIDGREVHIMAWERDGIEGLDDDKPYYFSAEIKKNLKESFTIMVKSSKPIAIGAALVENFTIFEPSARREPFTRSFAPTETGKSDEAIGYIEGVLKGEKVGWGVYHPGAPGSLVSLNQLEDELDYDFKGLIRYQTTSEELPYDELVNARDEEKIVQLTMQLLDGSSGSKNQILDVLNGNLDEYLDKYAEGLKLFGSPVLFRLNNEMNGDWCEYNALWMGKDTDIYKKAWIYIHDFMEERQVDNLIWVWNPNDVSYPGFKWNHWMNYFPGETYVDVIGLTGYNTGTYYEGERWRRFEDIYRPLYRAYEERFEYPFIVSEFGSNSVGGDKPDWIRQMNGFKDEFERIHLYFWFSGVDLDGSGNPARVYRIDENEETLKAFKELLQQ